MCHPPSNFYAKPKPKLDDNIWLFEQEHRELIFEVEYGSKRFDSSTPESINLDQRSVVALVAKQGQSYICNNPDTDPYYWRTLQDARAELAVPLRFKDQIIGVLDVESKKLNAYTEDHQKLLETLAEQAAIVWENARLYNEMEQRVQERTKTLEEATNRIAETQHILTRTTLAADFIHRMNNLAGTIPVWVDLTKHDLSMPSPQIPKAIEYLEYITADTNELLRAAEQLKTPYRKTQMDIAAILQAIVRQLRIQYGKDIKLGKLDIQQEIRPQLYKVWGMPSTLPNALFNVIANGIEAILPDGPGILTIRAENIKDKQNIEGVKIEIHDTGKGIVEKDRDKLFTPFFSTYSSAFLKQGAFF